MQQTIPARTWSWLRRNPLAPVLVIVAVVVRIHASGGLKGLIGYVLGNDPGIYFGAASGLVHGLMPYRDYTLVHPPGVAVFLAPFAWLAEVVGDPRAFAIARFSFIVLGAINTLLVYLVAAKVGRAAAIVAAAFYCVLPGPIWVERTTYLEAPMLTATLLGLLLYARKQPPRKVWLILAGIAFGIAISFKLWAAIPFLVIAIAYAMRHSIKNALWFAGSTVVAAGVIMLPFFAAAPSQMIDRILFDQAGREAVDRGLARLEYMFSVNEFQTDQASLKRQLLIVAVLVLMMVVCWIFERRSRLWVVLFGVQVLVGAGVPVFFGGYRSYYAIGLVLLAGTTAQLVWNLARRWWESQRRVPALASAAVVGLVLAGGWFFLLTERSLDPGHKAEVGLLSRTVAQGHCVSSWNPAWMIASNSLNRTLDNDCAFEVDLGGSRYGLTEAEFVQRRWEYLNSGDYVFVLRSEANAEQLTGRPRLVRNSNTVLFGPRPEGP